MLCPTYPPSRSHLRDYDLAVRSASLHAFKGTLSTITTVFSPPSFLPRKTQVRVFSTGKKRTLQIVTICWIQVYLLFSLPFQIVCKELCRKTISHSLSHCFTQGEVAGGGGGSGGVESGSVPDDEPRRWYLALPHTCLWFTCWGGLLVTSRERRSHWTPAWAIEFRA